IIDPGFGATLQDRGRIGLRRFGVPPSGAMDQHAAVWANHILNNPTGAAVLELLLQGARLKAIRSTWIAITGADAAPNVATWRAVRIQAGETLSFRENRAGVWIYIAVEGGFAGKQMLGSVSVYARGKLGEPFARGERLRKNLSAPFHLLA